MRTLDDADRRRPRTAEGIHRGAGARRGRARGAARRARTGRGRAGRGGGRPRGLGRDAVPAAFRFRAAGAAARVRRGLLERLRETPPLLDAGLLELARLADARAAALDRAIAEREGLPPAARALAEEGALLALDQVEVEPGYERAVAAAVGAALIAGTPAEGLALLESARERGLGNLTVLVRRERVRAARGDRSRGRASELLAATRARRHARGSLLRPGPGRSLLHRRHRRGGAARAGGPAASAGRGGAGAPPARRAGRAALDRPARSFRPRPRWSRRSRR